MTTRKLELSAQLPTKKFTFQKAIAKAIQDDIPLDLAINLDKTPF